MFNLLLLAEELSEDTDAAGLAMPHSAPKPLFVEAEETGAKRGRPWLSAPQPLSDDINDANGDEAGFTCMINYNVSCVSACGAVTPCRQTAARMAGGAWTAAACTAAAAAACRDGGRPVRRSRYASRLRGDAVGVRVSI